MAASGAFLQLSSRGLTDPRRSAPASSAEQPLPPAHAGYRLSNGASNAGGGDPSVTGVAGLANKNDGNDVSLDREARLPAENALRFQMASNLMRSQLRLVRSATTEGQNS